MGGGGSPHRRAPRGPVTRGSRGDRSGVHLAVARLGHGRGLSDGFGPTRTVGPPARERDALEQLVELAGERGDLDELRRLAAAGNSDARAVLVELATEREDFVELQRLADTGAPMPETSCGAHPGMTPAAH